MSKDCVIFSAFVHPILMTRGEKYLQALLDYFGDCDIFCGLNYGTDPKFMDLVEEYKKKGLKIEYKYVAPSLTNNSDNAGYQAALCLYKLSPKNYDLVHLTHTKSITHPDINHQQGYDHLITSFHKSRSRIKDILSIPGVGGWSSIGGINYEYNGLNKIDEFYKFPCQALEQIFMLTSFVVHNHILKEFIDNCDSKFFTEKYDTLGYNRYFFEFYFPPMISKMGFIPLCDEYWSTNSTQKVAREEMLNNFERWKEKHSSPHVYPKDFEGMTK